MDQFSTLRNENQICPAQDQAVREKLERGMEQFGLHLDWEQMARASGALKRHRGIHSARDLFRLVLGYSVLDYSLRQLGIWGTTLDLAAVSKTALLNRLRHCRKWLGQLLVLVLHQQHLRFPAGDPVRVKLLDATVICRPGSRGADWRLHLSFDLAAACVDQVELTDGRGAERMDRFELGPGEIGIGDKAYALARPLGPALRAGVRVVVPTGWNRLRLEQADGQPFDLVGWLRGMALAPQDLPPEQGVWVATPQGRFALRLIAQALSSTATQKARRRVRAAARKNHHTPDARSLYTAGFVLVLTNLPAAWAAQRVLELYRFRWQVEVAFKRLKSLLQLDQLRARDPELAQVYLLAKLGGVLLMERIQISLMGQAPAAFACPERPLSHWRLTSLLWEAVRGIIRGPVRLERILAVFPRLLRYLCDEPRARPQQLAVARQLLAGLGAR